MGAYIYIYIYIQTYNHIYACMWLRNPNPNRLLILTLISFKIIISQFYKTLLIQYILGFFVSLFLKIQLIVCLLSLNRSHGLLCFVIRILWLRNLGLLCFLIIDIKIWVVNWGLFHLLSLMDRELPDFIWLM